jgi:hypothetical protein
MNRCGYRLLVTGCWLLITETNILNFQDKRLPTENPDPLVSGSDFRLATHIRYEIINEARAISDSYFKCRQFKPPAIEIHQAAVKKQRRVNFDRKTSKLSLSECWQNKP